MFDLSEKVALVTGAGQGVGVGIAKALAAQNATIVVNDLIETRALATVETINRSGGTAIPMVFDVCDFDAVTAAVATSVNSLGSIDIMINNAGVPEAMDVRKFRDTVPADWQRYIDINLYGVMNCCRATIASMIERKWGRVITISSGAAISGMSLGVSSYAAGKGGAISFMRHLAIENARYGITANTVALGLMNNNEDEEHSRETNSDVTRSLAKTIPVGRLGKARDVGALCVYLASDEAAWMTGQTLELNGGSHTG